MDAFSALADPVRRDLLRVLGTGAARVVDLTAVLSVDRVISRPAVSKHLLLLATAGLVSADTVGRERHYRLVDEGLGPVLDFVHALTGDAPTGDALTGDAPTGDALTGDALTGDALTVDARVPAGTSARPPIDPALLDGLDLEIRRTTRERHPDVTTTPHPEPALHEETG